MRGLGFMKGLKVIINIFISIIGIMFILIIGLLLLYIILHIIDKILDIKEKKHQEMIHKSELKYIIFHLESISKDMVIASTKFTDEEKMRFVNGILPNFKSYLDAQIAELKKIRANATNIK